MFVSGSDRHFPNSQRYKKEEKNSTFPQDSFIIAASWLIQLHPFLGVTHNHSCPSHLLSTLLQYVPYRVAFVNHSEALIGSEYSGVNSYKCTSLCLGSTLHHKLNWFRINSDIIQGTDYLL